MMDSLETSPESEYLHLFEEMESHLAPHVISLSGFIQSDRRLPMTDRKVDQIRNEFFEMFAQKNSIEKIVICLLLIEVFGSSIPANYEPWAQEAIDDIKKDEKSIELISRWMQKNYSIVQSWKDTMVSGLRNKKEVSPISEIQSQISELLENLGDEK